MQLINGSRQMQRVVKSARSQFLQKRANLQKISDNVAEILRQLSHPKIHVFPYKLERRMWNLVCSGASDQCVGDVSGHLSFFWRS